MPGERNATLERLARASLHFDRMDPPARQQRHDMVRAKIAAFTQGQAAAGRIVRGNPGGVPAIYADAIGTFLSGNARAAVSKIDTLVRAAPKNPYVHEMRGEIRMKAGRPAEAASSCATAMRLDPHRSGIIQIGHGQALMATGKQEDLRKAVNELQAGLSRDREYAAGYRYLAQAYGQLGDVAQAELATADGHFYSGNYRDAKIFAARAQQKMPNGSSGWLRAQDIINYRPVGR